jgi:hypothetical protein
MSEQNLINTTITGQPVTGTPTTGQPLVNSNGTSGSSSTPVESGSTNLYPDYNIADNTDKKYTENCEEFTSPKNISSNLTFTIYGNYTGTGSSNIIAGSNCKITIQFSGGISNNIVETIPIPQGTLISLDGVPCSIQTDLKDASTIPASSTKLTMNIIVTIQKATVFLNVLTAQLKIDFKRNYNHLPGTLFPIAKDAAGIPYPNKAPGDFSTNLTSLTGTIKGFAGTFNSEITFTQQPSFTHIVYPSI